MAEKISYEIEAKGNLSALNDAASEIDDLAKTMDDLAKEEAKAAKSADKAADSIGDMEKEAKSLKGAFGSLMALGVGGFFAGILGAVTGAVMAGNNWVDQVDRMSDRMGVASEDASVLATSLARVGLSADEAEPAFSSFQGRLIDELESQKNIAKEVASIEKDRQSVLADLGKMEADHLATLTDLEAERASINNDGIAERIAQRDKELSSLSKDYQQTMDDLRAEERKENEKYAQIWQDRVKEYEKSALKLREDFDDKARNARNYREFREAEQAYKKQQGELSSNLQEEKQKHESAHQERLSDLEASRQRESEIFTERSAEIAMKADEDVAKLQQANAQAVADLDARIEEEKAAYAESTAAANERLGELANAQAEAQTQGAGLTFVMKELGVELFDADGKMRPVNDLIWDMKDALNGMEDGARKAAILSDLGWEDIATWVDDDTTAIDALSFAMDNNLIVTEEQIAAQREAEKALNDLKLQALGVGLQVTEDSEIMGTFTEAMGALSGLLTTMNEAGIFTAIGTGIKWMSDQVSSAIQMAIDLKAAWDDMIEAISDNSFMEILGAAGNSIQGNFGLSAGGLVNPIQGLTELLMPSFETGGMVPGSGPVPIVAHGGELVIPKEGVAQLRGGGMGGFTLNINAPVYGVNDLQAAIRGAIQQADNGPLATGVR